MLVYITKKLFSFLLLLWLLSLISVSVIYYSPNNPFAPLTFFECYYAFYQQLLSNQLVLSSALSQYSLVEILRWIFLPTFKLCLLASVCCIIIGLPIGIMSGLLSNSKFNHLIKLVCLILYASPLIWVTMLTLSITLLDKPPSPDINKLTMFTEQLEYQLLPIIILTIQPCIITIQLVSERVNHVANKNFIKVANIRENSSLKVLFRHLLPNTIPGSIPLLTYNMATLLFSSMVIEIIFNRVGLGTWVFSAFNEQNYLIIALTILSCGILTGLLTLLGEILVVLIYPIQARALYE